MIIDRLLEAVRAAVPAVTDVSVGIVGSSESVTVWPAEHQAAAQATIDAFDWSQAAEDSWLVQRYRAQAVAAIDNDRTMVLKAIRGLAEVLTQEFTTVYRALPRPITSITRSGTTATATTMGAHGLASNDQIVIFGADVAAYNGVKTVTVTGNTTFTYGSVNGNPATPATGSIAYALNASVPPLERTLGQAVTAWKAAINAGTVD